MHSDNQLIKKFKRKRDRQAANELISRYYKEIYAYTFKQVQDKELAMDLTQEIFIAVLKGLSGFDEKKAGFRTWLYTISSNKITDFYRSRYHRQRMLETNIEESGYELADERVANSMLDHIIVHEMMAKAMRILVAYGNDWVRIFQMKIFEEKTFSEIAQTLALSENTVKTRYYTMIRKLRKEMEEDYGA